MVRPTYSVHIELCLCESVSSAPGSNFLGVQYKVRDKASTKKRKITSIMNATFEHQTSSNFTYRCFANNTQGFAEKFFTIPFQGRTFITQYRTLLERPVIPRLIVTLHPFSAETHIANPHHHQLSHEGRWLLDLQRYADNHAFKEVR